MMEVFNEIWLTAFIRLLINLLAVVIVSRLIYYPRSKGNAEYLFTFISLSVIIFLVCILLSKVPVELGFALGLFAVFSIIRFRSIQARPRELAYLFICLGLALMNALLPIDTPTIRLVVNNIVLILIIGIADFVLFRNKRIEKIITYDRIDLLGEEKKGELEEDLRTRFGITSISKIQVGNIDTIKNRVKLKLLLEDREDRNFEE